MSANDDQIQVEAKSSIKTSLNAKREPQFEAKIVQGVTDVELTELRRQAVHNHRELLRELGIA